MTSISTKPPLAIAPPTSSLKKYRRRVAALGLAGLVVVALLIAAQVDVRVAAWVREPPFSPAAKAWFRWFRLPGHYGFTVVLAGLIAVLGRRYGRVSVALLLAGAGSSAVAGILKYCLGRNRPFRGRAAFDWSPMTGSPLNSVITRDLSFPSGDATLAFATAVVVAHAFPRLRYVAYGWAALVAMTRVCQGSHYPSDVTAGAFVGLAFGFLTCRWFDLTDVRDADQLPRLDSRPPAKRWNWMPNTLVTANAPDPSK